MLILLKKLENSLLTKVILSLLQINQIPIGGMVFFMRRREHFLKCIQNQYNIIIKLLICTYTAPPINRCSLNMLFYSYVPFSGIRRFMMNGLSCINIYHFLII